MFKVEGNLYRFCTLVSNFAILNLLFLISCIPIVTFFPGLAALFAVVRQFVKKKEINIIKVYWIYFAENFKQSFLIGFFSAFIGLCLFVDFQTMGHIPSNLKRILVVSLVAFVFYYILFLLSVFPLMVNSQFTTKKLILNAIKLSIYKPHLTLYNLIAVFVIVYVSFRWTFLLFFFTVSISAYLTYWFAERKYSQLVFPNTSRSEKMLSQ